MNKLELMKMANEVRKGAVTGVFHAKSGHPGGSLSAADIYTYLFFEYPGAKRQLENIYNAHEQESQKNLTCKLVKGGAWICADIMLIKILGSN